MLAAQERVGLDDRVRRQLVEPVDSRRGARRLRGPRRPWEWILYPPDVWSTKNGKSVKEAKATYHQRWWYARAVL